ncbi:Mitochondrial acidic protein mam33 [Tulasnella sp. JGI-2019a]|nr:Mitochondrial acidic protein mam33 [Tulasnella sp. JGI-2019a]KAG9027395.1 Mitochondrial acidic protein mam33 [Tulasnella sp. JGI-2019a]
MSSLRALKFASSAFRSAVSARSASQRSITSSAIRTLTARPLVASARNFSISARAFGQGETDVELASKLQEEINYEKEAAEQAGPTPEFVKEFQSNGVWKIEEKTGHDEIALTRKFGNEDIRVLFSIADIDNAQEPPAEFEDEAPAEDSEDAAGPVLPIRCSVTITKANAGALTLDCLAQEANFIVENVSYYADSKLASELTAEADWSRRGLYIGPQFDHLDVGVQEAFEKYLDERSIGPALAAFIPEYAEWKEQQEYTKWLQHVHKFVSA